MHWARTCWRGWKDEWFKIPMRKWMNRSKISMHEWLVRCRNKWMDEWLSMYGCMNSERICWHEWDPTSLDETARFIIAAGWENIFIILEASKIEIQRYLYLFFFMWNLLHESYEELGLLVLFYRCHTPFFNFVMLHGNAMSYHFVWCICWLLLLGSGLSPGHRKQ